MREREYTDVERGDWPAMLRQASKKFADLTASWIRVGYCQGNFNSDNCLVGGRTMDYGPFGFVERFQPLWNMWVGGGEHYGFMNQGEFLILDDYYYYYFGCLTLIIGFYICYFWLFV
jgi:uncharacterized protein YdiU (UPF0061 family)